MLVGVVGLFISIHAPREGSDLNFSGVSFLRQISIHAPREGSDASLRVPNN